MSEIVPSEAATTGSSSSTARSRSGSGHVAALNCSGSRRPSASRANSTLVSPDFFAVETDVHHTIVWCCARVSAT